MHALSVVLEVEGPLEALDGSIAVRVGAQVRSDAVVMAAMLLAFVAESAGLGRHLEIFALLDLDGAAILTEMGVDVLAIGGGVSADSHDEVRGTYATLQ